jgi:intein/homing endonuclease
MSFCGKGSLTKRVPTVFFNAKPSVKLTLIKNWIDGDGHRVQTSNNTSVCTSSFGMYKDFYQLSISCDIVPRYYQAKQQSHQNAAANILTYTEDHNCTLLTKSKTHLETDIGICLKVKNITIIEVENRVVYDIGVEEDHSFIADGFAIHNCVSRGWSRACDYVQLAQIVTGQPLEFKMTSHSFIYGASRVIGNWMSYQDGSVGAWAAKAVNTWGVCTREEVGDVPAGNDNLAVEWAAKGVPQKYKDLAKDNLIKKVTMVRTAEEAKAALINLFPIAVCSNRGFTTTRDSKGRCTPSGTWNHCYGAGTKISTPNGIVNIEDLRKGNDVYTSEGNIQHVTHNFERNYTGKVYTIRPKHAFEFTCTEEHPILVYTSQTEGLSLNSETYGSHTITWTKKKLVWKKVKDVVIGDLVISPTIKQHKFTEQPKYNTVKNHKNVPYVLDTKDKDTSWLFGLFAGDGNVVKNHKVTFTLSNKKQITKLANVIRNKIGLTPSIQEKQAYSRVTIYSSILAEYFREAFYNSKKEKIVPTFEMDNTSFIEGLKDADGTQCRDFVEIYNTSKDLLLGIQQIAIELGYTPKIAPRKSYKGCYPNAKQGYYITFGNNNKFVEKVEGNVCYPIDEIIVKDVQDMKVYNLEINKEHTYIAEGLATHNCMLISGYDDELRRFLIEQSWGQNNPSGPLYKDQPDNSFWADWDVVDGMLRQEDSFIACDLDAWMLREISYYL